MIGELAPASRAIPVAERRPNGHAESLHALGALYLRQGYPKQALALLLAARRFAPPSVGLTRTTIQAYLLSGAPKKALDLLDAIDPTLRDIHDRAAAATLRSRALLSLGRVREAQSMFERATMLAREGAK